MLPFNRQCGELKESQKAAKQDQLLFKAELLSLENENLFMREKVNDLESDKIVSKLDGKTYRHV